MEVLLQEVSVVVVPQTAMAQAVVLAAAVATLAAAVQTIFMVVPVAVVDLT